MKSLHKGALPEYISPYIKSLIEKTGGPNGPIGRQFLLSAHDEERPYAEYDPQEEAAYEVAPGMIYKYRGIIDDTGNVRSYGRILWTISRYCATYCRFCFRGRFVGLPAQTRGARNDLLSHKPFLSEEDLDQCIRFIIDHPEINEVILSGGDPLVVPQRYFENIIQRLVNLQQQGHLDLIRLHTRAPITNPMHMKSWHYEMFRQIRLPYIVLHINHPSELTAEVRAVVEQLRQSGAILLAQSVLLRGVNDSIETLHDLFVGIVKCGIRPYYLHQNDPVSWATSFTVPFDEAVSLWQALRPRLSGLAASAKFVIDTPHGTGKVVVPESLWSSDMVTYRDFANQVHCVN